MMEARTVTRETASAGNGRLEHLEQRVHRLEDAVAAFQDTRQLEERLVERVADRLARNPPAVREPTSLIVDARRPALPALGWMRSGSEAAPQAIPIAEVPSTNRWFLWDVFTEGRAIFRMFFDPRYRMTRWVRILSLGLLVAIFASWLWLPWIWLLPSAVSTILVKAIDLVLAFILIKFLSREVRRYRALFPDGGYPQR
jgi:hypothetical protein